MNGLKKIMSAAIAAATLLAGTTFTVSADYDSYDVNRDGRVSPADLVQLNRYLCGGDSVTNYNLCDVNKSLIVDAADAECLKARILERDYSSGYYSRKTGTTVSSPTVSGFTPSNSSSSSAERTYNRCRYENGQPVTTYLTYNLTPNKMTFPDSSSNPAADTRAVIGDDERYPSNDLENNGIVYLEVNTGSGTEMRTGFIVGDHEIATAAHCVYDAETKRWYSMTIKTYNSNGYISNNTLTPVEVHVPVSYTPNCDDMYDYALITVSDDLSNYVHFSLGTPYNVSATAYSKIPVYVTGFNYNKYKSTRINRLYSAEGRVMSKNNFLNSYCTDIICYIDDTDRGGNGAPVYTITKIGDEYVYTAIGINISDDAGQGRNWGSMTTNYHLQFYLNNPYARHPDPAN